MQIIVDGQSDYALSGNPTTLADVLLELTTQFETRNRILFGIVLDDEEIPPEVLTPSLGLRQVSDITSLVITSASLDELVIESLDEISEVIAELPAACHEIAQALSSDNPASCFGYFNQFLELWETLKERQLQILSHLNLQAESIQVKTVSLEEHNVQLNTNILKARTLMESSSFDELSACISSDLTPMAERESVIITTLRACVNPE